MTPPPAGSAQPLDASASTGATIEPSSAVVAPSSAPPLLRASDLEASGPASGLRTSIVPPDRAAATGRYVLTAFHARGGMGEVWRCQDASIGREVALKRLVADRPAARQRFLAEAQITGQLEHPGIVPIHDVGFDDSGRPYYVMKLVRGRMLKAAIDEYHASSAACAEPREVQRVRLLKVFLDLCHAVAYAHSRGVIHRDLKPENVMLGPYGETVLLDWGLAKIKGQAEVTGAGEAAVTSVAPQLSGGSAQTEDGSILGSPLYMPPEMAEGHTTDADQRTDVYLLGATLYEILTGRPPREGKSRDEILELARSAPPVSPRKISRDVPRALEAICLKAMSRTREARYGSAMELADDLQRFLAGEAVSACKEIWVARAWRWGRRHRRQLSQALAAIIVLTAVIVAYLHWREARHVRALVAARIRVERIEQLSDEARFYAASVDRPDERAPYFDPARGRQLAAEALATAAEWGPRLDLLPLADRREPLRRELAELCLLVAQVDLSAPGRASSDTVALLDKSDALTGRATRASRWLRARASGTPAPADAAAAQRDAFDLFLDAEEARLSTARLAVNANGAVNAPDRRTASLRRAVALYQDALRAQPSHFWARLQLGRCYLALGRGAEAAETLGACEALRPQAPWGYSARGLALAMLRRFDEAEREIDRALQLDPANLQARINRGLLLMLEQKPSEAAVVFDALCQTDDKQPPPEALYYRARLQSSASPSSPGDLAASLATLDMLLARSGDFIPARLLRATVRAMRGDDRGAADDLDAVAALVSPADARAAARGHLLRQLAADLPAPQRRRSLESAERELRAATEGGGSATALADLAAVLHHLGRGQEALEAYGAALARGASEAQVRTNRGWTLIDLARFADAADDFGRVIQISHDHAEALSGLAYAEAKERHVAEATRHASLALVAADGEYRILHNVACVYAALSATEPARAVEHEQTAVQLLRCALDAWRSGWGGPDEIELIRTDSAWTPSMRSRSDFKQLLAAPGSGGAL